MQHAFQAFTVFAVTVLAHNASYQGEGAAVVPMTSMMDSSACLGLLHILHIEVPDVLGLPVLSYRAVQLVFAGVITVVRANDRVCCQSVVAACRQTLLKLLAPFQSSTAEEMRSHTRKAQGFRSNECSLFVRTTLLSQTVFCEQDDVLVRHH